jgi:hypothetical protein
VRRLKLIFISEGRSDGHQWLGLDGDEASLRPQALIEAEPDLFASATVVHGYEDSADIPSSALAALSSASDICIIETRFETRIFTADELLHDRLLDRLKTHLPER